jgi:hypothetical protein
MSVNKWIDIIPPDMEMPFYYESGMYLICAPYIKRLSEVDDFRNFVVHKHYFRNG